LKIQAGLGFGEAQEQDIEGFNSVETPFPGLHVRNDVRSLFIQQVLRALVSAPLLKEPQLRTQHVRGGMRPPSFHARCGNQPPRRSALYAIIESVVANKGGYTLTSAVKDRGIGLALSQASPVTDSIRADVFDLIG